MSTLQRYRKRGGFLKLLQLIETSAPPKREQLLKVIEKEDPHWAQNIRTKSLSFEKFCSWKPETQYTVLNRLTEQYKIMTFKKLPENNAQALKSIMDPQEAAELYDNVQNAKDPLDGEFLSALTHLFETIRELDSDNVIILSQIDPTLKIPEAS